MTTQEEVRHLITTYGISQNWLSKKLGIKEETLHYLLYESPKFDEDLLKQIKDLVETYQFELNLFDINKRDDMDLFTDEKLHMGIGERIRLFAKRKYKTLKKLAEAMEMSPQQLQQYISGKREPGSRVLIKLLRLGCDINWLLGGREQAESYKIYKLESELRKLQQSMQQISSVIQKIEPH
ncbi:helix-turn-helix domain-containing protein [Bacteroidota bacterium]